jgi:hypothetical protein
MSLRVFYLGALTSVLFTSCAGASEGRGTASGPSPHSVVAPLEASETSTRSDVSDVDGVRVAVNSHCGVRGVWVKDRLWLASPPLGGHNPPPGWDENETPGVFEVTAQGRALFHGEGGQSARFRLAEPGTPDPNEGCE